MLKNIFRFSRRNRDGRIGYCYVADCEVGPMANAQVGETIRVEGAGPPWIVVDEAPTTAVIARWPGKLLKVGIIEGAAAKSQPLAYARYTRALSVRVLGEENPATLFGEHGDEVLAVLSKAMELDHGVAKSLSVVRHPDAPAAYDRTFRQWADASKLVVRNDGKLDGTLGIGSRGSPIYGGLILLSAIVFDRAKAIDGDSATTIDGEEEYLNEPWSGADAVLRDAALALGAPEFTSEEDRGILLSGWA